MKKRNKDATNDSNRKKEIRLPDKHGRMLSPICYQESENESDIVTSFHSHQKGKSSKSDCATHSESVKQQKSSFITGRSTNCYNHFESNLGITGKVEDEYSSWFTSRELSDLGPGTQGL